MNRLTKKNIKGYGSWTQAGDKYIPAHNIKHKECVNKLGELEDIEEKLGIDLVTLFEALENGIWIKIDNWAFGYGIEKTPVFIKKVDIGYQDYDEVDKNYKLIIDEKNVLCIYELPYDGLDRCARIKDYGRTWAMTREELENGK